MDMNDLNKDQLDEILKAMNDWVKDEIQTKGYVFDSEVQERFTEELEHRRFIENEINKPCKRPND